MRTHVREETTTQTYFDPKMEFILGHLSYNTPNEVWPAGALVIENEAFSMLARMRNVTSEHAKAINFTLEQTGPSTWEERVQNFEEMKAFRGPAALLSIAPTPSTRFPVDDTEKLAESFTGLPKDVAISLAQFVQVNMTMRSDRTNGFMVAMTRSKELPGGWNNTVYFAPPVPCPDFYAYRDDGIDADVINDVFGFLPTTSPKLSIEAQD